MNDSASPEKPTPISKHDLLLKLVGMPLYDKIELVGDGPNNQIIGLRLYRGKFDAYCPGCDKHSTWTVQVDPELERQARLERAASPIASSGHSVGGRTVHNWLGEFKLRIFCARDSRHHGDFYFDTLGTNVVVKVGQFPSLTDFQLGELTEFEGGMSKQQRQEFVRATNSTAHGFNVAACVYFRRVFESVLLEARNEYMVQNDLAVWQEFLDARTDVRIRMLRDYLPSFMSDHHQLYGVLSLGVHELTEEQCARELPMLRKAIELIMRDRVTAARQKREREEISKLVAQAVDRHKR
ncbi:MAG: hypothetical protein Q8M11_02130 [Sulfuritalea sp.]|nr:hypothetical protein [Sulfuritalea sp.]MDP1985398.1 hypothetical protein [Sulfuritalea sp.]